MATDYYVRTMDKKYKILMQGNFGKSYNQICDENHIRDAFKELGHEVFENESNVEILKQMDLILIFKSNNITFNHIRIWKSNTNAPLFMWTFDNMDRFPQFYPIAKECDLWLGEELGKRERFYSEGIPFYYFPNHSVNPKFFYPVESEKIYDVSFSGTPYFQERTDMLKAIEGAGLDLHIFGNNKGGWEQQGFKNVHDPVFDESLSRMVGQSKIVVGISNSFCQGYWSIRPAQVMLCKGLMIDRYCPGMERELKDGCEYWNNHEELISKIKYYLEHEDERNAIAEKGYKIAINQLTNKQRCAELIKLFENFKQIGKKIYEGN